MRELESLYSQVEFVSQSVAENKLLKQQLIQPPRPELPAGEGARNGLSLHNSTPRICVIGAGPSGLAMVKSLRDRGIACVCFEREDDVGGNWYFGRASSSVYESTHLISSKRLTQYADYPMPDAYPAYPGHEQALEYLRSYARAFDLYESIELNTCVEGVRPADGGWQVQLKGDGATRRFERVVICNGHHWSANSPQYPGRFAGEAMHSRAYKTAEQLRGRRVLVVGAGNSGCDIAVEAAQHADAAFLSVRRGYHFLPKFLHGRPIDEAGIRLQRLGLPLWLRRRIAGVMVNMALGKPRRFGLPTPDHRLFETHPIVNSQLFYHLGHGTLQAKPDVAELDGREVRFQDGSAETIDLIVYATGYQVRFPFIDETLLNLHDGLPQLFLHAFHPLRDDLFVVGMIQPNGALWPLAELQAKLVAAFIDADEWEQSAADWLRRLRRRPSPPLSGRIHFDASPRHRLEVDYFTYRRHLRNLLRRCPSPNGSAQTHA